MSVTAVCGVNWGDEGKGRMIDYLAAKSDIVIRFQGGNNAGHTVINDHGNFKLHLIPSGIFYKNVTNILGNGVVLNPEAFVEELAQVEEQIGTVENIMISNRSHVVFPFHVSLDCYEEERLKDKKFGSTRRGIAPVYSDKNLKIGIQAGDLLDKDYLYKRVKNNLDLKNQTITKIYGKDPFDVDEMVEWGYSNGQKIKHFIKDCIPFLNRAVKDNKTILLEGQLGAMRDLEFGIYPYTSSSSPIPGYASAGTSIPPAAITDVLGIVKAYSTCVGEGPFVTELFDENGDRIRTKGKEFGAATGRPRRIGWFDAVASKYGCIVTGATAISLTLLDVLTGEDEIKICTGYRYGDELIKDFPMTKKLYDSKPEYITMKGWSEDVSKVKKYDDLPENAKKYISKIEELIEVPIKYISVGPHRDELIVR